MEQTYGIGVNNRYDLFYGSDDGADPFELIAKKKAPKVKEPVAPASGNVNNTQQSQPKSQSQANEKENKQQTTLNKNQKDAANNQIQQQRNGPSDAKSGPPRRGIKEQQNNGNKVEGQKKETGKFHAVPAAVYFITTQTSQSVFISLLSFRV